MDKKKCILLCAGEFNFIKEDFFKRCHIGSLDCVIAVDGGLGYCNELGLEPNLIIGDFDSASEQLLNQIEVLQSKAASQILTLPTEKDDTDTLAAVKWGLSNGYTEFEIYGATGGRFDHYFANLQVLLFIKHHGATGRIIDNSSECFVIENESINISPIYSGINYVSVLTLSSESCGVTISGMKYNVEDARITNDFPIGISNEFTSQNACVSVKTGQLAIFISR